ncbi:MAG: peptide-methionine (S)-S-oxide reductase, partial [Rhizobium sp.]|nr:peptide-methionine (S)-S-oxide reductase [Rhizobium sp.]
MPHEIATLAGGCFWCIETVFNRLRGGAAPGAGENGGPNENPTNKAKSNPATRPPP